MSKLNRIVNIATQLWDLAVKDSPDACTTKVAKKNYRK
jgi:hypothetical protein